MNNFKYRLCYKVGRIEFSSPCEDEIAVLELLQEVDFDSYYISQYFGERKKPSGLTELILKRITKQQFIKNLMNATLNKGI